MKREAVRKVIEKEFKSQVNVSYYYGNKDILAVSKSMVIGVRIYLTDGHPIVERCIPAFILRILPFSEMLLLVVFYFPSDRFRMQVEKFLSDGIPPGSVTNNH